MEAAPTSPTLTSDPPPQSGFQKFIHNSKRVVELLSTTARFLFYIFLILSFTGLLGGFFMGSQVGQFSTKKLYGTGPEKVAVVRLDGQIFESSSGSVLDQTGLITPTRLLKLFEQIGQDPQIKAVILRVNSPGGSVTAAEESLQTIKRYKEKLGIPFIASFGEVAASGGYYISLAADTIVASPTSITGSVGVISTALNVKGLADKYGVRLITVSSGENKNFLNPLEDVEPDQVKILQSISDQAYTQFLTRVRETRNVTPQTLDEWADGRPLSGKQARQLGLVDKLGGLHEAVELARTKSGYPQAQVVEFQAHKTVIEGILGVTKALVSWSGVDLAGLTDSVLPIPTGVPLYLHSPVR